MVGPLRDADLPYGAPLRVQDEEAEFEVACQLFEAAVAEPERRSRRPSRLRADRPMHDGYRRLLPAASLPARGHRTGDARTGRSVRETDDKALARVRDRPDSDDGSLDDDAELIPPDSVPPNAAPPTR